MKRGVYFDVYCKMVEGCGDKGSQDAGTGGNCKHRHVCGAGAGIMDVCGKHGGAGGGAVGADVYSNGNAGS